jgi:hypothetical protein
MAVPDDARAGTERGKIHVRQHQNGERETRQRRLRRPAMQPPQQRKDEVKVHFDGDRPQLSRAVDQQDVIE